MKSEFQILRQKLGEKDRSIAGLRQQNAHLQRALNTAQVDRDKAEMASRDATSEITKLRSEIAALKAKLQSAGVPL